jgi:hypothetical protein
MPVLLCDAHLTVYELSTVQLQWLMTDKKIASKARFMTNNHATWFRQVRALWIHARRAVTNKFHCTHAVSLSGNAHAIYIATI